MIRELSALPYAKNEGAAAAAAGWDSTPYLDTRGSFAEVGRAFDEGLIDGGAYDQILQASVEALQVLADGPAVEKILQPGILAPLRPARSFCPSFQGGQASLRNDEGYGRGQASAMRHRARFKARFP
jgi:hypothetical protein